MMGLLCGLSIPYIRIKLYELLLVNHIIFGFPLLVAVFQCVLSFMSRLYCRLADARLTDEIKQTYIRFRN
jgi:hypothetical protein